MHHTNRSLDICEKIYDYFDGNIVDTIMYLTGDNIYIPSEQEISTLMEKDSCDKNQAIRKLINLHLNK